MYKTKVVIDLSDIPEAERAEKLVGFMHEQRSINVDVGKEDRITFSGYGVYSTSGGFEKNKFPPIKIGTDNEKKDVLVFLEKKIPETHQKQFDVIGNLSSLPKSVLKKITLDEIDWEATVRVCMPKIKVHESANSDYDKITIISIEGKSYSVRVDALPYNDDDKEILACRKHLLDVYSRMRK